MTIETNSRTDERTAHGGDVRLREVITGGGFTRIGRAAEMPFNLILEARP